MRGRKLRALAGLVGLAAAALPGACRADNYAMLVGIDEYQQSDAISGLGGASNDAKSLAKTLEQVAGYRAGNVRVLTSDGREKPTGANIVREIDGLARKVHPGDTLFVLFSGHGIELEGNTYLVPGDADVTTDTALARTSLPTTELRADLARVPARALVLAFDMCRTDPRRGAKGVSASNTLTDQQAKDLTIVPASGAGPQIVATLFSCSLGERSWEWRAQKRGYFSFYLEQGLRQGAADRTGVVRLGSLVSYLQRAVSMAVQREESHPQTPYPILEGPGAQDLVLATGRPPGPGGLAAVVSAPPHPAGPSPADALTRQGQDAERRKDYATAQRLYTQAMTLDPAAEAPVLALGQFYEVVKEDPDEAERLYRQAMALAPSDENAVFFLGRDRHPDHPEEGDALYKQAMTMDPTDARPVAALARSEVRFHNDPVQGELLYRQAIKLAPTNGTIRANLADCLYDQGRKDEALAEAKRALALGYQGSLPVFTALHLPVKQTKAP